MTVPTVGDRRFFGFFKMLNFHKWRVLRRLTPYLRQHRARLTAGIVCVLATNFFLLATPRVIGNAVDRLRDPVGRQTLSYYAAAVIALAICEGIFRFLMRRLIIGVSRNVEYGIRNDLFRHLE